MGAEGRRLVDARRSRCPGPLARLIRAYMDAEEGELIEVWASDPDFRRDVTGWTRRTGNELVELRAEGGKVIAIVRVKAKAKA